MQHMVKAHHFKKQQLVHWFKKVKFKPEVLHYLNKPLEKTSWPTYQRLFINTRHIEDGIKFWAKNEKTLQKAEAKYGVPASIIVATLGIETRYGQNMGNYRVIDALSNIAFSSSKRAPFFRQELEQFLLLTREEHFDPLSVVGSYAGAIGQPQFMPSSYRKFAVHFAGNKNIDLIHNANDVIGSIANYYHKNGWQRNQPVTSKTPLQGAIAKNKIILPDDKHPEEWIGFHNFDVIKRYNASNLYAMAVFQLSRDIAMLKERGNHGSNI